MSTKLFLGVMVAVLAIAGYVVYSKMMEEERMPMMGDGISFICEDDSYFSAEFSPDFSVVDIVIDGILVRSATRVAGSDLYMYEEDDYSYTFAGEKVSITNSKAGKTTICSQPFDPNKAPYNFGDKGEESDPILLTSKNLVGDWQSLDDQKFTRKFEVDGTLTDAYEGSDDTVGSWVIFNKDSQVETPFALETGVTYLRISTDTGTSEVMYYKITKVTPDELELIYMDRGGVLRFNRLKTDTDMEVNAGVSTE